MSARRRLMACDSFGRVVDVVSTLRRDGYDRLGTWSLPQVCHHLAVAVEVTLQTPPVDAPQTPEQAAAFASLMVTITSPDGLPPGQPNRNPAADPPADCTDAECDRLAAAYAAFDARPEPFVISPRFGRLSVEQSRRFHLGHANHHLSFLLPHARRRVALEYPDVGAALADVDRLRRGYRRVGQWTLAQVAHHVAASLRERMRPDADPPDAPEQLARRPILERVLAENAIAVGLTAPAESAPPQELSDDSPAGRAAVDGLVATLGRFAGHPGPFPPHRLFGRMTVEQNRRHQLVHAAHHLSHLIPDGPMTKPQDPIKSQ